MELAAFLLDHPPIRNSLRYPCQVRILSRMRKLNTKRGRVDLLVPDTKLIGLWVQAAKQQDLTLSQWIRRTLTAQAKKELPAT